MKKDNEEYEDELNISDYLEAEQKIYIVDLCLSDQTNESGVDPDPHRLEANFGEELNRQANIKAELREYEETMRLQEEEVAYLSALNYPPSPSIC